MRTGAGENEASIVVVGAGIAALSIVETLRAEGHRGEIVLVGAESGPPYDRPPLSKGVLLGSVEPGPLRPVSFLEEQGVQLRLGEAAAALDLEERRVLLREGDVRFDRLILATGARARTLPLFEGRREAFVLRTLEDALALRQALVDASRVVVVGAGFLGAEVASSARALGCDVTLVELDEAPLARQLGPIVGDLLRGLHERNGVRLLLGRTVAELVEGRPLRLRLDDGVLLEAEVVVVAVGAEPNTGWLAGSGLALEDGVVADARLRTGAPGVYAVGDIASWPNELFERRMRVEHWTNALEQGRHAALEALGRSEAPFLGLNYVWSDLYGVRAQFAGATVDAEAELVRGRLEGDSCLVWYRQEGRLVGAFGIDALREMTASRKLIGRRAGWDDALSALPA